MQDSIGRSREWMSSSTVLRVRGILVYGAVAKLFPMIDEPFDRLRVNGSFDGRLSGCNRRLRVKSRRCYLAGTVLIGLDRTSETAFMSRSDGHHAKLLVELPPDRYQILSPSGRAPLVGDEVVLDQGFTSPDGLPMVLVYFPEAGMVSQYSADVYESELGPDI